MTRRSDPFEQELGGLPARATLWFGSSTTTFAFTASAWALPQGQGFARTSFSFSGATSGTRRVNGSATTTFGFQAPMGFEVGGLWTFDEVASPAESSRGTSLALETIGANVTWSEPALHAGGGTSVKIASGSYLDAPDPVRPFLRGAEATYAIWFKQQSDTFGYWDLALYGKSCSVQFFGWSDYGLEVYGENDVAWDFYLTSDPVIYHDDLPHSAIVVVDAVEARLYIDGALVDSFTRTTAESIFSPPDPLPAPSPWTWGNGNIDAVGPFYLYSNPSHTATFDDLYIVNHPMTAEEIAEYSATGAPAPPPPPTGFGSVSTTFAFSAPANAITDIRLATTTTLNPGEIGVTVGDNATESHTVISGTVTRTVGADPILTQDYAFRGLYTISPTVDVPGDVADGNGWVTLASLGDFQFRLRRLGGTWYRVQADFVTAAAEPTFVFGQIQLANDVDHSIGLGVVRYHATGAITLWQSFDRWDTWSPILIGSNELVPGLLPDAAGESIVLLGGDLRDGPWISIFRAQWGGT